MTFATTRTIRFAHVDAAGIVFYPRYFELVNATIKDYFAAVVGVDFATMHGRRRLGVPTVKLDADFVAPSRLGDRLEFALTVTRVGTSSADIAIEARCAGEVRVRVRIVLVCMDLDTQRACAWPEDMRPV